MAIQTRSNARRTEKGLPLIVAGKYILHEKDSYVIVRMYFYLIQGKYVRKTRTTKFHSVQAAVLGARHSGLIYTNDPKVFFNQS